MFLEESFQDSDDKMIRYIQQLSRGDYRDTADNNAIVVDEKFSSDLHINLHPELQDIYIYGGNIPKFIQNKIQSVNPEKILKLNVISQIRDKFGDRRRFPYRGINSHNINATLTYGFIDDDKPRPPFHEEDILEGLISFNHDIIREFHDPIPSEVEQVVGRTELAFKAFENRLFA
ncbi:7759_t:CDS:2, partial [Funneliformis caledonium]